LHSSEITFDIGNTNKFKQKKEHKMKHQDRREISFENQSYLRKKNLEIGLSNLIDNLMFDPKVEQPLFSEKRKYRKAIEKRNSIWTAICNLIEASHLNSLDPAVPIQNKFNGKLKTKKKGLREWTSLWLFRDDVERLLRDLYGDVESKTLDPILDAVLVIVEEFAQSWRCDLWIEHQNAKDIEYIFGIGRPEGCSLTRTDYKQAGKAAAWNQLRAQAVLEHPSRFSKYTIEFARFWDKEITSQKITEGSESCLNPQKSAPDPRNDRIS
jgi:hypothetical protein